MSNTPEGLILLSALFEIAALFGFFRRRLATAFVLHFGAAHLFCTAALQSQSLEALLCGRLLYAPLLLFPTLFLRRRWRLLLFTTLALSASALTLWSHERLHADAAIPRPVVTGGLGRELSPAGAAPLRGPQAPSGTAPG